MKERIESRNQSLYQIPNSANSLTLVACLLNVFNVSTDIYRLLAALLYNAERDLHAFIVARSQHSHCFRCFPVHQLSS
jgi:hypothetical protein